MSDHLEAMNRIADFRRRTVFGEDNRRGMTGVYPMSIFDQDQKDAVPAGIPVIVDHGRDDVAAQAGLKARWFGISLRSVGGTVTKLIRTSS